ncbi:MAG: hypothetical protein R3E68_20425 [Burkholderiaceae bacterium]
MDPQLPAVPGFMLERSWPITIANGLGMDLANSFLVAVRNDPAAPLLVNELALHWQHRPRARVLPRGALHHTMMAGCGWPTGLLDPASAAAPPNGPLLHASPADGQYHVGQRLSDQLLQVLGRPGWSVDDAARFIGRYLQAIVSVRRAGAGHRAG